MPDRRSGPAAPHRRGARRRARLARVARRRSARARNGKPAHSGPPLRSARADRCARPGGGERASRDPVRAGGRARHGRLRRAARPRARLLLRAAPWSEGEGLDHGLERGGDTSAGMDEFYGRAMPAQVGEDDFVRASQLYARHALVLDDGGRDLGEPRWHEADLVQRFPAAAPGSWSTSGRCASGRGTGRSPTSSTPRARRAATSVRPRSCRSPCPPRRSSPSRRSSPFAFGRP